MNLGTRSVKLEGIPCRSRKGNRSRVGNVYFVGDAAPDRIPRDIEIHIAAGEKRRPDLLRRIRLARVRDLTAWLRIAIGCVKICLRGIIATVEARDRRSQRQDLEVVRFGRRTVELHVEIGWLYVGGILVDKEERVPAARKDVGRVKAETLHFERGQFSVGMVLLPASPVEIVGIPGQVPFGQNFQVAAGFPVESLVRFVETDRAVYQVVVAKIGIPIGVGDGELHPEFHHPKSFVAAMIGLYFTLVRIKIEVGISNQFYPEQIQIGIVIFGMDDFPGFILAVFALSRRFPTQIFCAATARGFFLEKGITAGFRFGNEIHRRIGNVRQFPDSIIIT